MTSLLANETRRLWSHRAYQLAGALLVLASTASLFYGHSRVGAQATVLEHLPEWTRKGDNLYFETRFGENETLGRAAYYLRQPVGHQPGPLATLALGQRDIHPYFLAIGIRGLYGQLFDSDLNNPLKALVGNFDFAFVLVFLFPLVLIGTSFNLLSQEQERGTLALVRATPTPLARFLTAKLVARLLFLLLLSGVVVLGSQGISRLSLAWLTTAWLYLLFWAGWIAWVVGWARGSGFSALLLVTSWLVLSVIGPAATNLASKPLTNGVLLSIEQRQITNEGWDRPKAETHQMATALDPRWRDAPVVEDDFNWSWYFAMHEVGDGAVKRKAADYFHVLRARSDWVWSVSAFMPSLATQLMFERLAGTDLESHLAYLSSTAGAHRQMKEQLLPAIFADKRVSASDLMAHERPLILHPTAPVIPWWGLVRLALIAGFFLLLGWLRLVQVEDRL